MTSLGYFLSCEQYGPKELIAQAVAAERAGFERLWISDHFHPWNDEQGQSPFVWSVIGALSEAVSLPVTTAVTCPLVRIHPAVIAQAAATAAVQLDGRFVLGLGSGEALNEHILGDPWPSAGRRLAMLEEAVGLIRTLHSAGARGEAISHHGEFYEVQDARIYTVTESPVPIYLSGFGPQATELAGRIGDGFCTVTPDAELIRTFRDSGGGSKPVQAGMKVAWGSDRERSRAEAHRLWPNEALGGQLPQILPRPQDFEAATASISPDQVAETVVCGDDPREHLDRVREYVDAGADEIYVQQIGPDFDAFFRGWQEHVIPAVG
ncbi:TIGR03557 family F420-dependent LLM class oxidoreductase [Amycolatopsis sp. PS_44_ISF1]|uniref:TIGR03557 family F420-dependent LLM class oxidoreductase n=1 Tax=Amycolatopsis sp. PS_44_ISF1 TaxID=2974917 RepID=UPI0028E0369F|nr:TIGR03557 family F420-dependent LLM class oxidoreductase [Amycolatopsis sp. PS_44_ISF1]MDT8913019.1 TIGR03557 family F420-dependent LLM class oxidoreductase [Amycolatopsis sp. PS_44_ISF1]